MIPALKFAAGPLAGLLAFALCRANGLETAAALTAAITAWTALWWLLEPISLGFTSLLPLVLFPLTGLLSHDRLADAVGNKMILLLLGSFMMSTAIEKTGAHRRLALGMIAAIGGHSYRRVVLGFMIAAGLLSAWISNTATTLMLLPVALAAVIVLALVPDGEGGRLLDWRSAVRIPWDLLLLIAAGIAISYAFESSGLSGHLVSALRQFAELPFPVVLLIIVALTCAITEVMNNTPVAALMMPILVALSVDLGRDPYHFMLGATLSASCAFMLPIATAPNAVVFSTGHVTLPRMAGEGLRINLIAIPVITLFIWFYEALL